MHGRLLPRAIVLAVVTAWVVSPTWAQTPTDIPTPEQFFGFPMGADRQIAHWDDMVAYYHVVAERAERVKVEELGETTLGHPLLLVTISTPDTIQHLDVFKAMQRQLADPRTTSLTQAEEIAQTGKVVVLISANVHATEIGTSQVMNDLIYRLAAEDSTWVSHVLDNTIVLLIPSLDPDGQRMVVEWYRRNLGTPYESSPLPELYHTYAGHDNNRDSYMLTQVETQHLNRVLYRDWLPEVYLDTHQMNSSSARIFVPPFRSPPNPNVDPLVWSEVNQLGQAMAASLHRAGKPGVIWGELYDGYWQGANNTTPWWHNMVGLLTEVATTDLATPVRQLRTPALGSEVAAEVPGSRTSEHRLPLAPPADTQARMNYPFPWQGGTWTFSDAVDYGRLAITGLLESVANNRSSLKRNFYAMNQRTIDRFSEGSPFAFVIPADQRDRGAVAKLVRLLQAEAAEIHVAIGPFEADAQPFEAGDYVVRLDQPTGRWIKDVLEPQNHPETRLSIADAPITKPYDTTAWTLGMLMGVGTVQIDEPFASDGSTLELLTEDAVAPPGRVVGQGDIYALTHDSNQSFLGLNRLLRAGADVEWALESFETAGRRWPAGVMLIAGVDRGRLDALASTLRLTLDAVTVPTDLETLSITAPRLGIYEPWGGNMDAGWTRWVLDQHEFQYRQLRNDDIQTPNLAERFDAIILPEMATVDLVRGQQARNIRPEYRGGIGVGGVRNLRRFVERGGTLITLGNSAAFALEHLEIALEDVVQDAAPSSFFAPGAILRATVDTSHPIGFGLPPEIDVMFVDNGALRPIRRDREPTTGRVVVQYPRAPLRRSGWLIGEEHLRGASAVVDAQVGRGRAILHTFRVQHRGQTWGTFKLLFNSVFYGPAVRDQFIPRPTSNVAAQ